MILQMVNYTTQSGIPIPTAFLSIARFAFEGLIRPTANGPRHHKTQPAVEMLKGSLGVYLTQADAAPAVGAATVQPVELQPFSIVLPAVAQLAKGATLQGEIYAALLKQTFFAKAKLIP